METIEPKEVAVPITSDWWHSDCTLEEDDEGYIFRFHGERKEYQPGYSVLEAALSLKLDENKPSPDVVRFINDYGPLEHLKEYEANVNVIKHSRSNLEMIRKEIRDPSRYLARGWGELDDVGRKDLMMELKDREAMLQSDLKRAKEKMPEGPYERWSTIYRSLRELKRIYLEWDSTGDLQALTEHLGRLQPRLVKHKEGIVWEFGFPNLFDALIGRLAESIVKGFSWKTCPRCHKVFINGKRTFCGDECREAYNNSKKSTPVGKEWQRLYQTLRRRRRDGYIDVATFEKVRRQLNEAQTVDDLKAIERKNGEIYARLKPGPTLNGGPRQYKD